LRGYVNDSWESVLRSLRARHRRCEPPGNPKAVQKLLGHSSISTTGDIYVDWDIDQLAAVLPEMQEEAEK
jgi:site-specific recombinase XerC